MLPDNIIDIIIKYQTLYEVEEIDRDIKNIVHQLKQINVNISKQLQMMMDGLNIDSSEQQLLEDSQILRKYIANIKLISSIENSIQNDSQSGTNQYESIVVNVVDDNICPKCNVKLKSHLIHYYTKNNPSDIWWYKCPCCNHLYCINNEIEDFYFEDTNIVLNHLINVLRQNVDLVFTDVIVLSSINACSYKEHNLEDVIANIPIIKKDGTVNFVPINISYCEQCNRYIMLKSDFKEIEDVIACQVIDQTVVRDGSNSDDIEIKQYESILYQYGYNVKAKENLSDKQRHIILASVIESNILTREQVCSHLDTLIERGSKIKKWELATQKWKQDRQYVKSYNPQSLPKILVDKIITKYSQIRMA